MNTSCKQGVRKNAPLSRFWVIAALLLPAVFLSCGTAPKTQAPQTADVSPARESPPPAKEAETPPPPEPKTSEEILTLIAQLMGQRNFTAAIALFDKIESPEAESESIQLIKASVFNAAGQSPRARGIATDILSREPNNTEALLVIAASAAVEGKDREQKSTLEKVIKIDPKHTKALSDLGFIALGAQAVRTATNYFSRALAADPAYGDAMIGRAIMYRYGNDPKKAEQLLTQAIDLYPQWASPLNERARLYKGEGFPREALADLDKAKALEPDNYWIAVDRGTTLLDLQRKEEALEDFTRAIELNPDNFLAYVYSAGIKDDAGDLAGAERDYQMLTKLKPEYYFAFEGLGMAKMRNRQWAEARDAFLSAYKYAPEEYTYALLATVNWARAGTINDPKHFLAQVIRIAPRESLDWYVLRLFHDLAGDTDAAVRIDKEQNFDIKARMLFYLANYYDIRGNKNLADRYFLQVQELDRRSMPEWRLNEWFVQQRGIGITTQEAQ